jgi:hypothetical protein
MILKLTVLEHQNRAMEPYHIENKYLMYYLHVQIAGAKI